MCRKPAESPGSYTQQVFNCHAQGQPLDSGKDGGEVLRGTLRAYLDAARAPWS